MRQAGSGVYRKASGTYQYELTDHLGNVRVVINQNKTSGDGRTSFKGFNFYQGEINQWTPNAFYKWSSNKNILLKYAYDQVDAPYVWLTNYSGNGSTHLSGEFASRKELSDAGIATLSNALGPMISEAVVILRIPGAPLNAASFNTFMKGTGITAATNKGREIRNLNYVIRQIHGITKAEG